MARKVKNGDIVKGPKGFVTFARFWELAEGAYKPIRLTRAEKERLCLRLEKIEADVFPDFGVVEDFIRTGRVREVREYESGDTLVRYEVSVRREDCSWDGPYQLLVLMNGKLAPKAYTIVQGDRRSKVAGCIYHGHLKFPKSDYIPDPDELPAVFARMKDEDSLVVGNEACDGEFMMISKGADGYLISWQAGASPWIFNALTEVGAADALQALRVYRREGIVGIQKLLAWEPAEPCDEPSRKTTVKLTRALVRAQDRAIRQGDLIRAKCLADLGIANDTPLRPFELVIDYDGKENGDVYDRLYAHISEYFCRDAETWTKQDCRAVAELLAYLAIWAPEGHSKKTSGMLNLGENFACGSGVGRDLIFAEYWIVRAAQAGDDYALVWLAHIYADPECPHYDKALAERFLNKAKRSPWAKQDWYRHELESAEAAITKTGRK